MGNILIMIQLSLSCVQARQRQVVHADLSRRRQEQTRELSDEGDSEEGGCEDVPQSQLQWNKHVLDRFR